jgi:hypothetical protein
MAQEYEAFTRDREKVVSGRRVALTLRDLTPGRHKFRGKNVLGVISETPVEGEPLLWLRSVVGTREAKPCSINIIRELPEVLGGKPYSDYFKALEALEGD